ncbi:MAG: zinc-ribbon domain-containing protein [Bacteroidales bacterium]|nr:zinc-ribbon domain-containing protein [Bacteroidales bacterium]
MANFCEKCGAPVQPDERFCSKCGAPLGAAPTQPAEEEAQGIDWKQFKPKLTIGKPELRFINKKKLIIYGAIVLFFIILVLFTK